MTVGALARLAARTGVVLVAGVIVSLIVAQYAHIIGRNVTYAAELHDVRRDIAALEQKRAEQQRDIARLSDPRGAIPEIHDRLHLVSDNETIIYLKRHDGPNSQ